MQLVKIYEEKRRAEQAAAPNSHARPALDARAHALLTQVGDQHTHPPKV